MIYKKVSFDSFFYIQSQPESVIWNLSRQLKFETGDDSMPWDNLTAFGGWLHRFEPLLPLAIGGISLAILLGCAVASWLCPSEKEDCLFHRHVM